MSNSDSKSEKEDNSEKEKRESIYGMHISTNADCSDEEFEALYQE